MDNLTYDILINLITEGIGILATYLIIDNLIKKRKLKNLEEIILNNINYNCKMICINSSILCLEIKRKNKEEINKIILEMNNYGKNIINYLKPIRERRKKYEDNPKLVKEIIEKGNEMASKLAAKTMAEVTAALKLY